MDTIPYGQAVTAADLNDAGIVVLLPTIDYYGEHEETWAQSELDALDRIREERRIPGGHQQRGGAHHDGALQ